MKFPNFQRLSSDFHKIPKLSQPGKWALIFPKLSQTNPYEPCIKYWLKFYFSFSILYTFIVEIKTINISIMTKNLMLPLAQHI